MILLRQLEILTEIHPVEKTVIKQALQANWVDFEDCIQNYTVEREPSVDILITRNIVDYKKSNLIIQTPEEYLVSLGSS